MLNRLRSSLLLLTFGTFAFAAAPALAQDAQDDAADDALAPDGGGDVASSETGDAADANDAKPDTTPDTGTPDTGVPKPDAATGTPDAKVDAPKSTPEDDDGCGCRIGGGKPGSAGMFTVLGALAAVGFTVRRRRRS